MTFKISDDEIIEEAWEYVFSQLKIQQQARNE